MFLKGTFNGKKFTFPAIYAPNAGQLTFIDAVLEKLVEFREGFLILGRDFNVSPDPLLDTSNNRPTHSYAFPKHFFKTLQLQNFSYYSKVHDVYTRIDILYVDHFTLE